MEHEDVPAKEPLKKKVKAGIISVVVVIIFYAVLNAVLVGGQKAVHHGDEEKFNSLKTQVETEQASLNTESTGIDSEEAQLVEMRNRINGYEASGAYDAHDSLVDPYNSLRNKYLSDVAAYNSKLPAYNAKVEEVNKLAESVGSTWYVVPIPTGKH